MATSATDSPALVLYDFLKARERLPLTVSVLEEINLYVESMKGDADFRLREVLVNFGWKDNQGFAGNLDLEGLCVAVRRSQISSSFLRLSILHNQDTTTSFIPEVLLHHLSEKVQSQEFAIEPASKMIFGACLLVDISGFTRLSSDFCARGSDGIDDLHKQMNDYLGELAAVIYAYGGDIIKYAGDAVLCLFPVTKQEAKAIVHASIDESDFLDSRPERQRRVSCCQLAIRCALSLKDIYTEDLSVHIAVTCGDVCFGILGGYQGQFESLIAGPCLMDLSQCLDDAKSREVVISNELYDFFDEIEQARYFHERMESGNYLLKGFQCTASSSDDFLPSTPLPERAHHDNNGLNSPLLISMVAQFLPDPVKQRLPTGDLLQLAELREVTTVFIKWQSYDYQANFDLMTLQGLFYQSQEAIIEHGGFIRQFIVDDKGCVLIALWGVPSASHIDNAFRAVNAASEIQSCFLKCQQQVAVGITTGKVFTGTVGSALRKEYAAIGDSVNMAARLMSKANGEIYLDYITASKLSKNYHDRLRSMGRFTMKGKSEPMEIYSYIVANAAAGSQGIVSSSNRYYNKSTTAFNYIRPQVCYALQTAIDNILAMHEDAISVGSRGSKGTKRSNRAGAAGGGGTGNSAPRHHSIGEVSYSEYLTGLQSPLANQHIDNAQLSGLGHLILLEGKTEFEKLNIISWLRKEVVDRNFNVKVIELNEEDRQYPLELWRKIFREIIGGEICDELDQLECYFFPLLKEIEAMVAEGGETEVKAEGNGQGVERGAGVSSNYVDEVALPILSMIFRIHRPPQPASHASGLAASPSSPMPLSIMSPHSRRVEPSRVYPNVASPGNPCSHKIPHSFITTLIRDCFDKIMMNHVRTVFIIQNLQFAAELSLRILLQTQEHPIFHIFFATSSIPSLSPYQNMNNNNNKSDNDNASVGSRVSPKKSKDQASKNNSEDNSPSGLGSDGYEKLHLALNSKTHSRNNNYEVVPWIRRLCSIIANVDIITLGPYSVDDIKWMLASIEQSRNNSNRGSVSIANTLSNNLNALFHVTGNINSSSNGGGGSGRVAIVPISSNATHPTLTSSAPPVCAVTHGSPSVPSISNVGGNVAEERGSLEIVRGDQVVNQSSGLPVVGLPSGSNNKSATTTSSSCSDHKLPTTTPMTPMLPTVTSGIVTTGAIATTTTTTQAADPITAASPPPTSLPNINNPPDTNNSSEINNAESNHSSNHRQELAKLIYQLSDGNAFWVEEFVGFIAEAGVDSFMQTMRYGARSTSMVRRSSLRKSSTLRGAESTRRNSKPSLGNQEMANSTTAATIITSVAPSTTFLCSDGNSGNTQEQMATPSSTPEQHQQQSQEGSNSESLNHNSNLSTLEAFVLCRFERLTPDVQKVVRIAAVLGYRFSRHVLYGVLQRRQRNTMNAALQQLIESKWITKVDIDLTTSTNDYKFNHPLLQSTLYHLTPATDRKELHRSAAKCLLEVYGPEEVRIYSDLIEHFAEFDHHEAFKFTIQYIDYHVRMQENYSVQILRYIDLAVTFANTSLEMDCVGQVVDHASMMIKATHIKSQPIVHRADSAVILSNAEARIALGKGWKAGIISLLSYLNFFRFIPFRSSNGSPVAKLNQVLPANGQSMNNQSSTHIAKHPMRKSLSNGTGNGKVKSSADSSMYHNSSLYYNSIYSSDTMMRNGMVTSVESEEILNLLSEIEYHFHIKRSCRNDLGQDVGMEEECSDRASNTDGVSRYCDFRGRGTFSSFGLIREEEENGRGKVIGGGRDMIIETYVPWSKSRASISSKGYPS
eukprot:scaffold8015_cov165-Ochromonas_danica.AAC.15